MIYLANDLEVAAAPPLQEILSAAVDLPVERLPQGDGNRRTALLSEAIRIGICSLMNDDGEPVHPHRLRGWVRHKVRSLLPDAFVPGRFDFRSALSDGRDGSLHFVGDIIPVAGGGLYPAPTTVVKIGREQFCIISGLPTAGFQSLRRHLHLSALSRQLNGVNTQELQALRVPIIDVYAYLQMEEQPESAGAFLKRMMAKPASAAQPGKEWTSYLPRRPHRFGFAWGRPGGRPHEFSVAGEPVIFWAEPISQDWAHYWLQVGRDFRRVEGHHVKRLCMVLDALHGQARAAQVRPGPSSSLATVSFDFPMFESLFRLLQVVGAERTAFAGNATEWTIQSQYVEALAPILRSAGVTTTRMGEPR